MKPLIIAALCSVVTLAACDGENPFQDDTDTSSDPGIPEGTGGTPPSVNQSVVRFEERNGNGGGFAEDFEYDAATDTFSVDNLAFDGENTYTRGVAVADLGPNDSYLVYDAAVSVPDFIDNDPVPQIRNYRAVVGVSNNLVDGEPRSSFAIVRTGGFAGFGFGGFVYQREGGVVMPNTGQAVFEGDYGAVRIFSGPDGTLGGLEFVEGDMRMEIDFDDPNDGQGGVKGNVTNRVAFDINGDPVTLGNDGEAGELPLPTINFVLDGEVGNINAEGEMTGGVFSNYTDPDGEVIEYESGTYYAILAGDTTDAADGGEIVGIMVLESEDPRFDGVIAQETGGFILYR